MGHKITDEFILKGMNEGKYTISKDVPVSDDWLPCYPGNTVFLSLYITKLLHPVAKNGTQVVMSVWGADDDGMFLRSPEMSPSYAFHLFNTWKEYVFDRVPDGCNHEWFFEHGFYYE